MCVVACIRADGTDFRVSSGSDSYTSLGFRVQQKVQGSTLRLCPEFAVSWTSIVHYLIGLVCARTVFQKADAARPQYKRRFPYWYVSSDVPAVAHVQPFFSGPLPLRPCIAVRIVGAHMYII